MRLARGHSYCPDKPCKALDISLVTQGLNEEQAKEAVKQLEEETRLATTDVWRFGVRKLLDAIIL